MLQGAPARLPAGRGVLRVSDRGRKPERLDGLGEGKLPGWDAARGGRPDGGPPRRFVEPLAAGHRGAARAGRERLPAGGRVEPPRAGRRNVGPGGRGPLPGDVHGAARGAHRADGDAVSLHAAHLDRGARRLGVGGYARCAGGLRRAGRRRLRRPGRLVVHDQRAQRAGRQELPGRAMAARRARSGARRAGDGGADARARLDDRGAARRATAPTPTETAARPRSGSPRTCGSSTRRRPARWTGWPPASPTGSTTSRSWTPSRWDACASSCRASPTSTSRFPRWPAASTTWASTTTRATASRGGSRGDAALPRAADRRSPAQRPWLGDLPRGALPAAGPLRPSRLAVAGDRERPRRRRRAARGPTSCAPICTPSIGRGPRASTSAATSSGR